jgi:hypothetical protein
VKYCFKNRQKSTNARKSIAQKMNLFLYKIEYLIKKALQNNRKGKNHLAYVSEK